MIYRCVNYWLSFLRTQDLQLFTVNQHYLYHLPALLRQLGPARAYSGRAMERAIGEQKRRIRSRCKPGKSAENALTLIAAGRYFERIYMTEQHTEHSPETVIETALGDNAPELWAPFQVYSIYSEQMLVQLPALLEYYWKSACNLGRDCSLQSYDQITCGTKYFKQGCVFDSTQSKQGSSRMHTFVKVSIPVDRLAHQPNSDVDRHWRVFFGFLELLFVHEFNGQKETLCLLRLCRNVKVRV